MALEKQHILTKEEKAVMRLVYDVAEKNNGMCLLTPIEIFEGISLDVEIRESELWTILRNLEIDDYFDVTPSERKGELVYAPQPPELTLLFWRKHRSEVPKLHFFNCMLIQLPVELLGISEVSCG